MGVVLDRRDAAGAHAEDVEQLSVQVHLADLVELGGADAEDDGAVAGDELERADRAKALDEMSMAFWYACHGGQGATADCCSIRAQNWTGSRRGTASRRWTLPSAARPPTSATGCAPAAHGPPPSLADTRDRAIAHCRCVARALRIQEALALAEPDLDNWRGSILVRAGRGGRRREVVMDEWGWEQLGPWLTARLALPVGPLFCITVGPTRGRSWSGAAVRTELWRSRSALAKRTSGSDGRDEWSRPERACAGTIARRSLSRRG